jgi:DNA-binding FadR family transcriptional regulator
MNLPWQSWKIARANTREDLAEQWRQAAAAGLLPPGSRMPNERLISQLSGLSRSTVRAFLAELEHGGRIRRHVGRGTFVSDHAQPVSPSLYGSGCATPAELLELRLVVEPTLVDLIVLKSTDEELEKLASVARLGREVEHWQQAEQYDRAFHGALFEATGNRVFKEFGRLLSEARDSPSWLRLKEGSYSPQEWARYQLDHEGIVTALFSRNADSARAALKRHLGGIRMER